MKRFLSLLVVLALVLTMVPAVFAAEATVITSAADKAVTADAADTSVNWTAPSDGTVTVSITSVNPGIKFWFGDNLPKRATAAASYAFDVTANTEYLFKICGYYDWSECTATVSYEVTFNPADEGSGDEEVVKDTWQISDTKLVVGENPVTALATAENTLFEFEPTEIGVYTFTAPEGVVIADWNTSTYPLDVNSGNNINTVEWECSEVGQSRLIGITADTTITVAKTSESEGIETIEYTTYVNEHTPAAANVQIDTSSLTEVNIAEEHSAVLGADGYYHLDAADGPVLFIDLNNDEFEFSNAWAEYGALTMRGKLVEDGETYYYDFLSAMYSYNSELDDNGTYLLTIDLIRFVKAFGEYQGWYNTSLSPFAEIKAGTANADTQWMVMCGYDASYTCVEEPEIPVGTADNPAELVLDAYNEVPVVLEDGWSQFYYYTWTAEKNGILTLDMGADNTVVPYGFINTEDYSIYVSWYNGNSKEVEVTAGATLSIRIATYSDVEHTYQMYASFVEDKGEVCKIGSTRYMTLAEAVAAAEDGDTITMIKDAAGSGVVIDKDITIDLNGYTYTFNQTVGSTGTTTLGFQILKDNTVTIQNGTLTSTDVTEGKEVKVLIQNYANLTLTDVNLVDNTDHILYCLSNNSGEVYLNGDTNITTDAVAFDVYDYTSGGYELPTVYVSTTGTISGKIEVSEGLDENLQISAGTYTMDVSEWCVEGKVCDANLDGTYTVNYPLGAAQNPIEIQVVEGENALGEIGAGETVYYKLYYNGKRILSVENGTINYNGEDHEELTASSSYWWPITVAVTNNGEAAAEMVLNAAIPVGLAENPAEMIIGDNSADVESYSSGYYFNWTAEYPGELTITIDADCTDWTYVINNYCNDGAIVYGENQSSATEDWWGNELIPVWSETLSVSAGDLIEVIVGTFSHEAGTVSFTAEFVADPGYTAANPIILVDDGSDDSAATVTATATQVAETTYYAVFNVMEMETVITGEGDFSVIYNGETYTAVDGVVTIEDVSVTDRYTPAAIAIVGEGSFDIVMTPPVGDYMNPAALVIGENTAVIEKGEEQGYYFTWTAEEDSILALVMPADGNWSVAIDNLTTYANSTANGAEAESNSIAVEVAAGETLRIAVNTYDSENPYAAVADANVAFTAALPVAEIDGVYYGSVSGALAAAKSGETVKVLDDCTDGGLIIKPGVTLNLGAHTVEAEYVIGLNGSMVTGTTITADGIGAKLVVDQDSIVLSNTAAMAGSYTILPIWDPANECFVLAKFGFWYQGSGAVVSDDGTSVKLGFKHQTTAYAAGLLSDGSSDNALSIIVRAEWNMSGAKLSQQFVYTDAMVAEVTTIQNSIYTAGLAGCDTKEDLVISVLIVTDAGVVAYGESYPIN